MNQTSPASQPTLPAPPPRHPVLLTLYNTTPAQLDLTKQCLKSVLAQDVGPLDVRVEDDGSTSETVEWLGSGEWQQFDHHPQTVLTWTHRVINISPLVIWNEALAGLFRDYPYVLLVSSDVALPTNFYSEVLRWPRGVVTGADNGQVMPPDPLPTASPISEDMPMNVMLLRRWAWEAVMAKDGYFYDEGIFFYVSDCDLAVRFAQCGIRGVQLNAHYWHFGSACHRLAPADISHKINEQAERDRKYFEQKHGFACTSWEYGKVVRGGLEGLEGLRS